MPNWNEVRREIDSVEAAGDAVRRKYLRLLHEHTGRNVIAYYSAFLSKPDLVGIEISDEDKNGFMTAVHGLDKAKGVDLLLHTPGGDIAATQSIVHYLQSIFGTNMRAVVPQIAMSAGTMIACSCREIVLGKQSNLGPIDPHLAGVPAYGVLDEFDRAVEQCKEDPGKLAIWREIIGKYHPTFLGQCEQAIDWANAFVKDQLTRVMFGGEENAAARAAEVVEAFSNYWDNKTHARHIHAEECRKHGLKVTMMEDDPLFQDLVLTVHHCYMQALMNTRILKGFENHQGGALFRFQVG